MVNFVAGTHLMIIFGNTLCLAMVIAYEPIWIWLPLLSLLVSPFMGGTHCFMNRLENQYRIKACMPLIKDRLEEFLMRKN